MITPARYDDGTLAPNYNATTAVLKGLNKRSVLGPVSWCLVRVLIKEIQGRPASHFLIDTGGTRSDQNQI